LTDGFFGHRQRGKIYAQGLNFLGFTGKYFFMNRFVVFLCGITGMISQRASGT
jgi:hypothetical protein